VVSKRENTSIACADSRMTCDELADHCKVATSVLGLLVWSSRRNVRAGDREFAHCMYRCCCDADAMYVPQGEGTAYWHAGVGH